MEGTKILNVTRDFEKFAEGIKEAMERRYPDRTVELKQVQKNNGVVLTGITISSEGEKIYPTMYLENFYEESSGVITESLLDEMCSVYEARRLTGIDMTHLTHYDNIKDMLRVKLINYEANKARLEEIPHRKYMDLAIVPYVIVSGLRLEGEATFTVKYNHLEMWDVTGEQVLEDAIGNTLEREQVNIKSMYEMLTILDPRMAEIAGDELKACPMYVMLTERASGAISMMFEDKIKEFCEKMDSDVYIIPSSVEEVILIPVESDMNEEALGNMIKDVNRAELREEDVLSDHAYYFDRKLGYKEACA